MTKNDQVKKLLKDAENAFTEYKTGLSKIKNKRQKVLSDAVKKAELKKTEQIKNKIKSL
jgi:F0F1-type ATP synthase membrane subunit b/b'